jgi:hypothetical protein
MSYADLLKDPRWQKKRLEVLESNGWACEACGSATKTLHVHCALAKEESDAMDVELEKSMARGRINRG